MSMMQGGICNPDPNQRRVTIMISDVCEPCSPPGDDHIDLQALTFLKVRSHVTANAVCKLWEGLAIALLVSVPTAATCRCHFADVQSTAPVLHWW